MASASKRASVSERVDSMDIKKVDKILTETFGDEPDFDEYFPYFDEKKKRLMLERLVTEGKIIRLQKELDETKARLAQLEGNQ
ncbi:hypothetical protein HDV00_012749 [Rhizophlyctis rosea]|nr:hypothetical protein HDV00_012749 [Rhizophlyctis rosea]